MEAPVEEERPRPPQPMPPPSPAFVVVLAGCLFGISLAILVSFTEEVPEVYMVSQYGRKRVDERRY